MKKRILAIIAIMLLLILPGCSKNEHTKSKYPGYYSSEDSWDFKYDSLLGGTMEFSAGEAKAYLDGKYLNNYILKGYVYRMADNYIYLKDKKSEEDYILVNLDSEDMRKISYEDIIYVDINNMYKILGNYVNASVIHENDIEKWDTIVTVKELKELEQLLNSTVFIVYGRVDNVTEKTAYSGNNYYWIELSSTKNGYMKDGYTDERSITANVNTKVEIGDYVKLSCKGENILGHYSGLTDCELLDKGEQYRNKILLSENN